DIKCAFENAAKSEDNPLALDVLNTLLENANLAAEKMIPICQDTGLVVVFADIGQDVHIVGGDLEEAINQGVTRGYEKGYLRKSVVRCPLERQNTKDNTPAVIHYQIVPGDTLSLTVAPKGFGSENMSAVKMLKPSAGLEGLQDFVLETILKAGPNPCPPRIVSIGVGGTMEKAALLAKRGLLRPVNTKNTSPFWQEIEDNMLSRINALDVGPAGLGGRTTALAVHISPYPTHIAGLPVALNLGCHFTRHAHQIL
ncbi:MAG: fumarate hydratase, partial [Candidatus Adiutrix sp.]